MKTKLLLSSLALSVILVSTAAAVPKYYEIGNGSTVSPFQGPEPPGGSGLVIQYAISPTLAGTNFILDDGQMTTFSFFDIWTDETTVNSDDTVARTITATLDFFVPNVDPTITGTTVGQRVFFGILQNGQLTWDGPVIVNVPGDRSFKVTLSDETFNFGLFGLFPGEHKGATVEAKIEQLTSVLPVPENANTAICLAGALAGLVALGRFRRA